jgi:hypothetical protein
VSEGERGREIVESDFFLLLPSCFPVIDMHVKGEEAKKLSECTTHLQLNNTSADIILTHKYGLTHT